MEPESPHSLLDVPGHPPPAHAAAKKCLVVELWNLGDAAMMTPILRGLRADGRQVTVLGRSSTQLLLQDDYPDVHWILFDAPWTAFHGKYHLWRWPWVKLLRLLGELRRGRFTAGISGRHDPRDHLLLWLAGIPHRVSLRSPYSLWFLTDALSLPDSHHRVEDWWEIQQHVSPTATTLFPPRLGARPDLKERFGTRFAADPRPVLAIHCGARIVTRRWPERYLRELITALRSEFDFQLALYPDIDGYGQDLGDLAQHLLTGLTLPELKASLVHARLLIANDSGLGHVAAALGVPVVTIFGTGEPSKFRPYSPENLVIMRDICPYRPCLDYCRFPEPYCLTQLTPAIVLSEIRAYLQARPIFTPL
jgi:heptosyltransferase-2